MIDKKSCGRLVTVLASCVIAVGLSAGCSSEGADISCSTNSCTVTFDRGVDAKVSVLGVDVKLVEVQNNQATIDIGGSRLVVPVGDTAQAQDGGWTVSVQKITSDEVVLEVKQS